MSIRNCHSMCYRDPDTNELFCPAEHKWVEVCPKEKSKEGERREDDD